MLKGVTILGLVFAASIYRAVGNEAKVSRLTGVMHEAFFETLRNDFLILAVVLLLVVAAASVRSKVIALTCFFWAVVIQSLVIVDVVIRDQFSSRLMLADVKSYGGYALKYIFDFDARFLALMGAGLVLAAGLTVSVWRLLRRQLLDRRAASIAVIAISAAVTASWLARDSGYVHNRLFQNFISYNRTSLTEFRRYSDEFAEDLSHPFERSCRATAQIEGPLIIYMVESLSSYHSDFFSGLNDWTPALDRLAADHLALLDLHANGFTTEDGELALLTAEFPIYPPSTFSYGGSTHFAGYWDQQRSLVSEFEAAGYRTHFLTTSDLEFSSTGEWMTSLGFDTVQGSDAALFDGWPRFHFDAAPDEALIDGVLAIVEPDEPPALVFVKTATSHHPFIQPETGVRSEEEVIRYVDRQIETLHQRLSDQGFFDSGHLIVVGDHRAMRPLASEEIEKYGLEKANTQIPGLVIGPVLAPKPETIDAPLSQADIANSLMGLASARSCSSPIRGAIWGPETTPPEIIIHRRGDQRNQFSVFAGETSGTVTLNGDQTYFSGDGFDPGLQEDIVEFINYKRVKADQARARRSAEEE